MKFGWHFLDDAKALGHGDGREVREGETLSVDCLPTVWKQGLHASSEAIDALRYAPGSNLCRVAVWGNIHEDTDKFCGRHRHTFWMIDIEAILWEWLCDVAQMHLLFDEGRGVPADPRSLSCIEARRTWLQGGGTDMAAVQVAALEAARERGTKAAWIAAGIAAPGPSWRAARDYALLIPASAPDKGIRQEAGRRLGNAVLDRAARMGLRTAGIFQAAEA